MANLLALEPYYGGSHQAFIDGWIEHSCHRWTLKTLPAYKWKWRMRHSAISLAAQVNQLDQDGERFDAVWASDMLPVSEFRGLANKRISDLPFVLYFHENQFTYPNPRERDRDHHFAFTNYVSCLAADQIWFNSSFHLHNFLDAVERFLNRMPDYAEKQNIKKIAAKSRVEHPGIAYDVRPTIQEHHPRRILWSARWEHDKNPQLFFDALRQFKAKGMDFRLNLLGQHSEVVPSVFAAAIKEFEPLIDFCGYAESREDYVQILRSSDVLVSTADHEFFGIGVVEALAVGVIPVLPNRLSYPELLAPLAEDYRQQLLYDGSCQHLVEQLTQLWNLPKLVDRKSKLPEIAAKFAWNQRATTMDNAVLDLINLPLKSS